MSGSQGHTDQPQADPNPAVTRLRTVSRREFADLEPEDLITVLQPTHLGKTFESFITWGGIWSNPVACQVMRRLSKRTIEVLDIVKNTKFRVKKHRCMLLPSQIIMNRARRNWDKHHRESELAANGVSG